jgi:hypothetical protein
MQKCPTYYDLTTQTEQREKCYFDVLIEKNKEKNALKLIN